MSYKSNYLFPILFVKNPRLSLGYVCGFCLDYQQNLNRFIRHLLLNSVLICKILIMKNTILFLAMSFLMSCNSNSSSTQNQPSAKEEEKNSITKPVSERVDNIFEGMYTYMADANMFISCDQKMKMSIEMKGEYLNLEKQYLRTVDGGTEVFVKLKCFIKKVPAMEGDKMIDALILEEILELTKDKKCP